MPAMDYSRVAHLYDAYVRTDCDVPFFLQEAKGAARVLELMSGTGRLSIPLIQAGVKLTCVDSSAAMLTILRKKLTEKGLTATLHEMDVCDLLLSDQYDLIVVPFQSFAEILTVEEQRKTLGGIRKHLATGGRFICTLHNPYVRLASVNGQLVSLGKCSLLDGSGTLFLSALQQYDEPSHIVRGVQFYEVYGTNGVMRSKSFVDIQFYVHEKDAFMELVKSMGFKVISLYGDYTWAEFDDYKSPYMIWILEKNGLPPISR